MDVFVDIPNISELSFKIEVYYSDTVLDIKEKIEKSQRIPVSKQLLYFRGKIFQDHIKCKIRHNSRLELVIIPHHNKDQVLINEKSQLQSIEEFLNSDEDIIYGEDVPLTTEQVKFIQSWSLAFDEIINSNQDSLMMVEESNNNPPLNSSEEIINDNNDQELQTEKSPPLNSREQQLIIAHDNVTDQLIMSRINSHASEPVKTMRLILKVLTYSGEGKPGMPVSVPVNITDNAKDLRKKLAKLEKIGRIKLPQGGYYFMHKQSVMNEEHSFSKMALVPFDTIEIIARHVTSGSHTFLPDLNEPCSEIVESSSSTL